jgi:CelD/BcsL family acetyltransferase involved in cellulose biosynthesis
VNVSVCRPSELGAGEIARWHSLQHASGLENPFLSPEFACDVDAVFTSARVAVVDDGGDIVGFLPFTSGRLRSATGIGGRLANCQAFVCAPAAELPLGEVVRGAGISMFGFHALVPPTGPAADLSTRRVDALTIDLSGGYAQYLATARHAGGKFIKEIERKGRRLEREHPGTVRFEFAAADRSSLACLLRWKSAQYRRSGRADILSRPRVVELVERLVSRTDASLSGCVSSLSVDDRLVAVDVSLRSATVFAGWLTSYDVAMAKWSPGAVATMRLIEAASAAGLRTLDLATGDETFKQRLANSSIELASGWVGVPSVGMVLSRSVHAPPEWAHRYIVSHPPLRRYTRRALQRYGAIRAHHTTGHTPGRRAAAPDGGPAAALRRPVSR